MKTLKPLPIIFILFAATASAFSISSLVKQAEVIKVTAVSSASSAAIKVQTMVRGFAANDPYMIKTIEVPKVTYMTRLKAGMGETGGFKGLVKRNAWYAGWLATMAAAGWAIDELTNQVTSTKRNYYGRCDYGGILFSNSATVEECSRLVLKPGQSFVKSVYVSGPNPPVLGQITLYETNFCQNGFCGASAQFYFLPQSTQYVSEPVTDDALYDSIVAQMLKDPQNAAQAFMVPDAYPYPYPDLLPSQVPYIPGVSEADQEALDLYYRGLLQSTNPNAPYYVSPERYQQIASLANQLQQSQTPESQTSAANSTLKNPLTQPQLEETLKKRDIEAKKEADDVSRTDTKPVTDAYKNSKIEDEFNKLKERVTDTSKMPALPDLPASGNIDLPKYTGCKTITTNFFNATLTFPSRDQCAKLEQVKTGLGYLMYVLTALGIIMELFRRVE